jgi:predicted metal-dependent enzyme (double-stranded beta helix superfamily)
MPPPSIIDDDNSLKLAEHIMLDIEQFVADCRVANAEDDSHKSVREVIARAVSEPGELIKALGEPTRSGVFKLYHGPELTVLNVVWAPRMTLMPHNHEMWAVIGMYSGREDNIFWRRTGGNHGEIEAAGAESLAEKIAKPLGKNIIHSVTNPLDRFTAAIHVYGGDFFNAPRSEWNPEDLTERAYDVEKNMQLFETANKAHASVQ